MDNTLVSARVPKAKKEAAAKALSSEGATMSDLINLAIDDLLENGHLPGRGTVTVDRSKERFEAFVKRSTVDVDWPENTPDDYRELEREWRLHDYESLA